VLSGGQLFWRSAAPVLDVWPLWGLVPQAHNRSSSMVGLSLLLWRVACPAICFLSTMALKIPRTRPLCQSIALALSCPAAQRSPTSICSGARPFWSLASQALGTSSALPLVRLVSSFYLSGSSLARLLVSLLLGYSDTPVSVFVIDYSTAGLSGASRLQRSATAVYDRSSP